MITYIPINVVLIKSCGGLFLINSVASGAWHSACSATYPLMRVPTRSVADSSTCGVFYKDSLQPCLLAQLVPNGLTVNNLLRKKLSTPCCPFHAVHLFAWRLVTLGVTWPASKESEIWVRFAWLGSSWISWTTFINCKVASTNSSCLKPHASFFRLSMNINLMFIYCEFLGKSWFPYHKHLLILATVQ